MTKPLDELNALEELEAEELSGMSYLRIADKDQPKLKLLAALAYVHHKRTQPDLKFQDFMKSTNLDAISEYLFTDPDEADEDEAPDPFPDGDAGAAPAGVADAEGAVRAGDGDPAV